jgi:class 3 adenylate cyclase
MKNQEDYRLAAIMFTDIYGFSSKMEQDEKRTLYLLSQHNEIVEKHVKQYNGHVIKTIGDAFLVDFKNTVNAVQCAAEVQDALHAYNEDKSGIDRLYVRIGIHLGDIWFFENDAFGDGINVASRLESIARPGSICISAAVHDQVKNKVDYPMESLGKAHLKNISRDIQAFEIPTPASVDFSKTRKQEMETDIGSVESENINPEPESDQEIKDSILRNLKIADNRISLTGIQNLFNIPEKKLQGMLVNLTESGLLVQIEKENGEQEFSFGSFNKLLKKEGPANVTRSSRSFGDLRRMAKIRKKKRSVQATDTAVDTDNDDDLEEFQAPGSIRMKIKKKIEKLLSRANQVIQSFIPELIFFPVLMVVLYFINTLTTPAIPWFLIPLVFGTIGTVNKFFSFLFSISQRNLLVELPDSVDRNQYRLVRQLVNSDKSFIGHVGTFTFFTMMFFLLNCLTSPTGFPLLSGTKAFQNLVAFGPVERLLSTGVMTTISSLPPYWSLFPLAVWGAGLFIHLGITLPFRARLASKIQKFELTVDEEIQQPVSKVSKVSKHSKPVSEYDKLLQESYKICENINDIVTTSDTIRKKFDTSIESMLDDHIGHIEKMKTRVEELDNYLDGNLLKDVDGRIKDLEKKVEETVHDQLKEEYRKSIDQLQGHKMTTMELEKQRELLYLRFTQAVMSLKQLELDITNLDEVVNNDVETSIRLFEEQARDLGAYVKNIKKSYRDIDSFLES